MTAIAHDEPCTLVIFGASGDLTKRKLIPALWSMFQGRVLPEPFAVVGVARSEMTNEQFRGRMREAISDFARVQPPSARVWDRFAQALFYYAGDPAAPAMYPGLTAYLKQVEQERGTGANRLFYVATPPSVYPHLVTRLGEAGLSRPTENSNGWVR
ncbi:MAG: glucose-6-phosphate dehydrogenase, partial [Candidatus Rokuibacteriota bacterium]